MRSELVRRTRRVCSQHCLKVPSTPVRPRPSTISLVSRNGTFSGILSRRPYLSESNLPQYWLTYILENDSEINMNQLSGQFINQDIGAMSIANTQYVADDTGNSYTPSVIQSHREPSHGFAMLFGKVVSHDRFELLHELDVSFSELGGSMILLLKFFQSFSEVVRWVIDFSSVSALLVVPNEGRT